MRWYQNGMQRLLWGWRMNKFKAGDWVYYKPTGEVVKVMKVDTESDASPWALTSGLNWHRPDDLKHYQFPNEPQPCAHPLEREAYELGADIEFFVNSTKTWRYTSIPAWCPEAKYRIKPVESKPNMTIDDAIRQSRKGYNDEELEQIEFWLKELKIYKEKSDAATPREVTVCDDKPWSSLKKGDPCWVSRGSYSPTLARIYTGEVDGKPTTCDHSGKPLSWDNCIPFKLDD